MRVPAADKIWLGVALVLAIGSMAGFGLWGRQAWQAQEWIAPVALTALPYVSTAPRVDSAPMPGWDAPAAQPRGREWVYDLFTPPEIFFNARTRQFTVHPPSSLSDERPAVPFGVEVLSVRPEPFRLQMIGYVGAEGEWRGVFQKGTNGEVFLARSGQRESLLGVSIVSVTVQPQEVALPEGETTRQNVATAVVRDERTGRDVALTHRERQWSGEALARVAIGGAGAQEVKAGTKITSADTTYTIERISLTPASVEITREASQHFEPERRVLLPGASEGNEGAPVNVPR